MDYIYVCRPGDNEELRYSIRSTVKNLPEGRIWVIGSKPDWYVGNFIPVNQRSDAYSSVRENLATVCNSKEISEDIVLMNDDFFTLKSLDSVPTMHGGPLINKVWKRESISPNTGYTRMLRTTLSDIQRLGIKDSLDYELHVPMTMTKSGLLKALRYRGLWRSIYGNLNNVGGSQMDDVKVYGLSQHLSVRKINIEDETFISTDDKSFASIKDKLDILFPEPTDNELAFD